MRRDELLDAGDVPATFDAVAAAYDRQVDLNPGYHANLRRAADALLARLPGRELSLLDVGCGSGASTKAVALALLRTGRAPHVLGLDGSAGMLAAARAKHWPAGVRFAQARAERLAECTEVGPEPVDGLFAAYLVRNVPVEERQECVQALVDRVRPGGAVALHDYSVRGNAWAAALWTVMCWGVVIPLGWLTARHTRLYRYLWRSVLDFDSVEELAARLRAAGLVDVRVLPALGWHRGLLHTLVGSVPALRRLRDPAAPGGP